MAIDTPYTTSYPTSQDTPGVEQPNLTPDSSPGAGDGDRVRDDHIESLRDKLQAVAVKLGDDGNLPAGSLLDILSVSSGDAQQVRFIERGSDPTNVANKGFVYTKDDAGVTELYYIDSAGNVYQLSPSAKANLNASAAPAVGDDDADGYSPGSLWVDTTGDKAYVCVDASTGAAIWIEAGGGSSPLTTKGDLYGYSTADARIPVGTDGQILTSDSSQATGVKWDSPITAQGVRISISDDQPGATIPLDPTDTKIMPESGASIAFDAPVAGKYDIRFSVELFANANSTCQFKIVFDEGTGDEQSVGYGDQWQVRQSSTGDYIMPCFFGEVALSAGSHTAKAYGKDIVGDGQIIGSGTVAAGCPTLVLVLVSGSAAGGTLLDAVEKPSDQTSIASGSDTLITGMQLQFSTFESEDVKIVWDIQSQASATENSTVLLMRVDSGTWFPIEARTGHDHLPFSGSYVLESLTAKSYTVEFGIRSDQTIQAVRGGGDTSIFGHPMTSKAWAVQYRGGLTTLDTKPLKGEWQTATTVDFAAHPRQPSKVQLTLQDGIQRSVTGTLNWAVANGVADLGYDEAGSQGNSKWLHFYAVPSSGDNKVLTVRASDNAPSTGPASYTNFKWLYATYIDGSGNLRKIYQVGEDWFYSLPDDTNVTLVSSDAATKGSWTNLTTNLALAAPVAVAEAVLVRGFMDGDAGQVQRCFVEPGNPPTITITPDSTSVASIAFLNNQENSQDSSSRIIEIPDGTLSYYINQVSGSGDVNLSLKATGFRVP